MNNTEHPILRRHRLITGQAKERDLPSPVPAPDADIATAFVATVAANLESLARPHLHIAPPREELHERLARAGRIARSMKWMAEHGTAELPAQTA